MAVTTRSRSRRPTTPRRSDSRRSTSPRGERRGSPRKSKSPKSGRSPSPSRPAIAKRGNVAGSSGTTNSNNPVALLRHWLGRKGLVVEASPRRSSSHGSSSSPSKRSPIKGRSPSRRSPSSSPRLGRRMDRLRRSGRRRAARAARRSSSSCDDEEEESSEGNERSSDSSSQEETGSSDVESLEISSDEDKDIPSDDYIELPPPRRSASRRAASALRKKGSSPSRGSPMKKRTKAGYERRSRGICEEDQQLIRKMIQENQQPAVILSSANYDPLSRRKRIAWTPGEVMCLQMGVDRFGLAWSKILKCPDYKFHPHRKGIDLKDKWRNITAYRPYGSHGKRTFVLVDENHRPVTRADNGKPFRFANRWPRDAALKAACRSEFYAPGRETTTIYVREVISAAHEPDAAVPPIVHVYEGTRHQHPAPPHLNQVNVRTVWTSDVRKIREERFVSREDLQRLETRT